MAVVPRALSSCTISVRDPQSTRPAGRLQFDVRAYQIGALTEFCDTDQCVLGPDGEPLRGLGINLFGVDQTEAAADPPAGYVNPLGITASNELFVDLAGRLEPVCTERSVGGQQVASAGNVGGVLSQCVSNTTGRVVRARRRVTVVNASVIDPPRAGVSGSITVDTSGPSATIDCDEIQGCEPAAGDVEYRLTIGGDVYSIVRAMSGQSAVATTTFDLPAVTVAADGSLTTEIQAGVVFHSNPGGSVFVNGGTVRVCTELVSGRPSDGVFQEPTTC